MPTTMANKHPQTPEEVKLREGVTIRFNDSESDKALALSLMNYEKATVKKYNEQGLKPGAIVSDLLKKALKQFLDSEGAQ